VDDVSVEGFLDYYRVSGLYALESVVSSRAPLGFAPEEQHVYSPQTITNMALRRSAMSVGL